MAIKDEIKWFKEQFAADVIPALAGTPISFDLVSAIAFQESGELWSKLRLHLPREEILRLSVGDTLDDPNRSAFPKNKEALIAVQRGQAMFELAHRLLVEMADATGIEAYQAVAQRPHKFVHGYGIFQYDLQFFRRDPDFFLEQRWKSIDACVDKMMTELKRGLDQLGFSDKASLTDRESAFVAIVYNTGFGNFRESRELQQGHHDGTHFYGENIDRYLKIAHTIPTPSVGARPTPPAMAPLPSAGRSIVAIAKAEFDRFHGIDEGDEPLRSRIADYYEAGGGSRNLDPTLNENAWSAAFVSFCVKQSGATPDQFKFNLSHSVFVRAAIANGDADRGVFRGHRVTEYAPRLGDLVHHNRDGGTLSFDFARANTGYPSHSAIVVDFEVRNGVRHAVTIGGNEGLSGGTGTVGMKRFPLDANGFLNQSAIGVKLICVVENQLAAGVVTPAMPLGPHVVSVRTDLKLRGGPGPTFPVIAPLLNGTPLNVLEFEDNPTGRWALVDLEGDGIKDGFVFAKFIVPVTS
ncbi:DUF2272 domain-containing protein [Bradyrhizobium sp. CB3481]|uniref:DUF2272 domain-containing protein n=1 Tax=Bradyrhizobium sp. CB3481 TaxID=3039158 RepID=UPI0024B15CBD|nr:DUF2272 domain-containing protein [Bradyrhizobium sp. CB3481]WFU14941.1 DUF2272 domain-containing protein [Bradyrhizobium sp. CB3481]